MKKKLTIIVSIVIAFVIVGCGYLLYIFQIKEYEVADDIVDEIIYDPYDVILPNGTRLVIENANDQSIELKKEYPDLEVDALKEEYLSAEYSVEIPISEGKGKGKRFVNIDSRPSKYTDRVTVSQIKKKYELVIKHFHYQADKKLDYLTDHAQDEYSVKKESNENVSYAYMYNKYKIAEDMIELQTDTMFNGIMGSLEKGLESNGYHKVYSKSFRDEYEEKKKVRHKHFLTNVLKR